MPFRVRVKKRALAYAVCSSLGLDVHYLPQQSDGADDVCNNAKSVCLRLHSLYKLRPVIPTNNGNT